MENHNGTQYGAHAILFRIIWTMEFRKYWPIFLGFPGGPAGKESACNVGDLGLIPGLERSPGEGKGYPLQYSGLENSKDCIVHGISELVRTGQLSLSLFIVPKLGSEFKSCTC